MRRPPGEEGSRWLEQGEEDLSSAKYLLAGGKFYLVCFLAQQIAEKALKGYLYSEGEELVTGHSVEELCQWAAKLDPGFKRLGGEVSILDNYYIPTRYPNGLPASIPAKVFNKKAASEALALAEKTLSFVRKKLG
jgi:HEPN domain-containing protein